MPKPRILGADGAGIREDTGEEVVINPGLEHGEIITVIGEHMDGTHAELVAAHAEQSEIVSLATLHLADALYEGKHYPESSTLYRALATEAKHQSLAAQVREPYRVSFAIFSSECGR